MVVMGIFWVGQFASHWREWALPLTEGISARQVIVLPQQLSWDVSKKPWLLFDTTPDDHFEIKINGQFVKDENDSLVKWCAEDEKYRRIWRGLPLNPIYLQPRTVLEVEVRSTGKTGIKLYGDFPSDDPAIYFGPAIDYKGDYRSSLRRHWSPIHEPRVSRNFDLQGIIYKSSVKLATGQILTDDLSSIFGNQHGLFRIYVGWFDFDEAPSVANNLSLNSFYNDR
jgi:hypothetical protein